jgi:uncharacterized protein YijF (DUF1287 family)
VPHDPAAALPRPSAARAGTGAAALLDLTRTQVLALLSLLFLPVLGTLVLSHTLGNSQSLKDRIAQAPVVHVISGMTLSTVVAQPSESAGIPAAVPTAVTQAAPAPPLIALAETPRVIVAEGRGPAVAALSFARADVFTVQAPGQLVNVRAKSSELLETLPGPVPLPLPMQAMTDPAPLDLAVAQPVATAPAAEIVATQTSGDEDLWRVSICSLEEAAALSPSAAAVHLGEPFGLSVARAARAQTRDLVIYTDQYWPLRYPMGDVPSLYGVCTDVVIRAFRAAGVDLQVLVHEAKAGSGDVSIDHRRTEILRKVFARTGQSLPLSAFPEDYLPGDVVTFDRPQNPHARSHIAIVSDVLGPSGRPMIVHNRGWGPQLEDALFVDTMTGHYRFLSPPELTPPVSRTEPRALRTSLAPRNAKSARYD